MKLGTIHSIDYSWGEIRFESDSVPIMGPSSDMEESPGFNLDIEPDDIQASDTVTVEWEIE